MMYLKIPLPKNYFSLIWVVIKKMNLKNILDNLFKEQYALKITKSETNLKEDELHIGYLKLSKIAF